jgi:hypothetical protein
MATYEITAENRNACQERFLETGGLPPEGVKMLGRWHNLANLKGFILSETDYPISLGKWFQNWTDIVSFEISPVTNDEETAAIIKPQ